MEKAGTACPISGPVVTTAWAISAAAAMARIRFRCMCFAALYSAVANSAAKQLEREAGIQLISRGGLAIFPGPESCASKNAPHENVLYHSPSITPERNDSSSARDEAL